MPNYMHFHAGYKLFLRIGTFYPKECRVRCKRDVGKLIIKVNGMVPSDSGQGGGEEVAMASDEKLWLDEYAVTCRVFKGRWSIRHCLRMYNDIKDLKIHMSSRARGKVTRYESCYNPCERCKVLNRYIA